MKKINDWVIRTFGLRGSWSWAKKQMLNGAINILKGLPHG